MEPRISPQNEGERQFLGEFLILTHLPVGRTPKNPPKRHPLNSLKLPRLEIILVANCRNQEQYRNVKILSASEEKKITSFVISMRCPLTSDCTTMTDAASTKLREIVTKTKAKKLATCFEWRVGHSG